MNNIELVAALKMMNLRQLITTSFNYRFVLSDNQYKSRVYINKRINTFYIAGKNLHASKDYNQISINKDAISIILKFL